MLKVLIVEDEENVAAGLSAMLALVADNLEVVDAVKSVKNAKERLQENDIDIVFLDIELEDGTGLELLKQISDRNFEVIFTTAYSEYAVRAFKFNAIDYLLKPLNPEELKLAVQRAIKRLNERQLYASILPYPEPKERQKIRISTLNKEYVLNIKDILYLQADGAYTTFVTSADTILVSKNIGHYEDILSTYNFVRTHQSYLVNLDLAKAITTKEIELVNGTLVPVSTRKISEVRELLRQR